MSRCQIYQPSTRGFQFARNSGVPRLSSPYHRESHPPLNSCLPASHLAIMHARLWLCQEGNLKILPAVVEGKFAGFRASETSGMRRTISGSPEDSFLRVIPRYGMVSHRGPPCPSRASMANQRVEGISPASDHVILASRHREEPAAPDELVPWFQGTTVMNEPKTPMVLETMTHGLLQQLGSQEKLAFKPAGASWEVETMERRAIVPMTRVTLNTTWYQGRSRSRSQHAQEPG